MFFGAGIEPLIDFVGVSCASTLVIVYRCSINPWLSIGLVFVTAVPIAMANIIAMLRAIVDAFEPFVSVTVFVDNFLVGALIAIAVIVGTHGRSGGRRRSGHG